MRKMIIFLLLSVVLLFIGSASIVFMPLSSNISNAEFKLPVIINGLVFWISFIFGYLSLALANSQCKKINCEKVKRKAGLFCFFSNRYAKVFDVLMVVSFIALVLMMIFGKTLYYVIFIILALLVFSINMHCIFNGRVVRTIIYKNEERRKS